MYSENHLYSRPLQKQELPLSLHDQEVINKSRAEIQQFAATQQKREKDSQAIKQAYDALLQAAPHDLVVAEKSPLPHDNDVENWIQRFDTLQEKCQTWLLGIEPDIQSHCYRINAIQQLWTIVKNQNPNNSEQACENYANNLIEYVTLKQYFHPFASMQVRNEEDDGQPLIHLIGRTITLDELSDEAQQYLKKLQEKREALLKKETYQPDPNTYAGHVGIRASTVNRSEMAQASNQAPCRLASSSTSAYDHNNSSGSVSTRRTTNTSQGFFSKNAANKVGTPSFVHATAFNQVINLVQYGTPSKSSPTADSNSNSLQPPQSSSTRKKRKNQNKKTQTESCAQTAGRCLTTALEAGANSPTIQRAIKGILVLACLVACGMLLINSPSSDSNSVIYTGPKPI
ncbi:MAG: hypothetical protein KIT27_04455 [Legionellales bacterium]|nr:hypothetical protein [Legionellales bacterium]